MKTIVKSTIRQITAYHLKYNIQPMDYQCITTNKQAKLLVIFKQIIVESILRTDDIFVGTRFENIS